MGDTEADVEADVDEIDVDADADVEVDNVLAVGERGEWEGNGGEAGNGKRAVVDELNTWNVSNSLFRVEGKPSVKRGNGGCERRGGSASERKGGRERFRGEWGWNGGPDVGGGSSTGGTKWGSGSKQWNWETG